MNVSYEYYRIFYYVAKHKNLTTAAELLHSSQPNVSRTIKLLEHELGCKLLLRSNRGITLTPEGELLYAHVKTAVEQIQTAEEKLRLTTSLHQGCVTVGTSETALRLLLLPVLKEFKKMYPKIRIKIQTHLTNQAVTSVKHGLVDFALVASPADISRPLKSQSLMQFQDVLIAGNEYSDLIKTPLSIHELGDYPLICLGEHTMTYQFYEKFYRANHLLLKPELEAATTDQIMTMVKGNLGLGFIPQVFAQESLESGEIFQLHLQEPIPQRELLLIENEEQPLTITAEALKKMLIQYI